MTPEELRVPWERHDDMEPEEPDGHFRRLVVVLDQHPLRRVGGTRRLVDADLRYPGLRRYEAYRLGIVVHLLPRGLKLDHTGRQDEIVRRVLYSISRRQPFLFDEIGERLVDVNSVIEGAAVLIDGHIAESRLLDQTEPRALVGAPRLSFRSEDTGRQRRDGGEDVIDSRVGFDSRRPVDIQRLGRVEEVLPRQTVKGAFTLWMGRRFEERRRIGGVLGR